MKQINIKSICLDPQCSECKNSAAKIEIVEPNGYPKAAVDWGDEELGRYQQFRNFASHYLIYSGPGGSNGNIGNPIGLERKLNLVEAFTKPYNPDKIRNEFYDMAGYCLACDVFYCSKHWNTSIDGYGKCPKGHEKSLDPHWSPEY